MMNVAHQKDAILKVASAFRQQHRDATEGQVIDHVIDTLNFPTDADVRRALQSIVGQEGATIQPPPNDPYTEYDYDDAVEQTFPASDPPLSP